jgi:hypothetical protein
MSEEPEKKERVIHMRVEPSLDSELKERAERLGVSVSNLVRNILQHAFGLAGDVIRDSQQVARSARGEAPVESPPAEASPQAARPGRLLGWQPFTLGLNALCERCNAILPKGTEASIGVLDGPGPRPIHCNPCVRELTDADPASRAHGR